MSYWFQESKRICKTFQWAASDTWERMRMFRAGHVYWREESLTENTLYRFVRRHPNSIRVHQFVGNEHLHGADWEWWIIGPTTRLRLRIQAKKLNRQRDEYPELFHPHQNPGHQLSTLIATSMREGAVPLYVFYNYWDASDASIARRCKSATHPQLNGCTVAHANSIRVLFGARDYSLQSVSAVSTPWDCLVCCGASARFPQYEELPIRSARTIASLPGAEFNLGDYNFEQEIPPYVVAVMEGESPEDGPDDIDGIVIISDPLLESEHWRVFE